MASRQSLPQSRVVLLLVAIGCLLLGGVLAWLLVGFGGHGDPSVVFVGPVPGRGGPTTARVRRQASSQAAAPAEPREVARPAPVRIPLAGVVTWTAPVHANALGRPPARPGERTLGDDELPLGASWEQDPEVSAWVQRWQDSVFAEKPPGSELWAQLGRILRPGRLEVPVLYDLGRAIAFVSGRHAAQPVFQALVARARKDTSGGIANLPWPQREMLRCALRGASRPLWLEVDLPTSETLMTMLAELEPPGSFEAWRARSIVAQSLYMRMRVNPELSPRAAEICESLLAEAPALKLPEALVGETHLCAGYSYMGSSKWKEAMAHFELAAGPNWPFGPTAARYAIESAITARDAGAAARLLEQYAGPFGITASESAVFKARIASLQAPATRPTNPPQTRP